jgi:hypothetical protein
MLAEDRMNLSAVLTLEESLRAIGQRLETLQARHVELTIEADGIDMRAGAIESENRYWTWGELAEGASEAPDERDGPTHWTDASVLTSWPLLLRVLGYLLDARGVRTCELQVAMTRSDAGNGLEPLAIIGGREELDARAFFLLLLRLRGRVLDATAPAAPAGSRFHGWRARRRAVS